MAQARSCSGPPTACCTAGGSFSNSLALSAIIMVSVFSTSASKSFKARPDSTEPSGRRAARSCASMSNIARYSKEAGIELGEKEEADEAPDTFLTDGMVITISREKNVKLKVDGKSTEVTTKAVHVSEFLEEQKITLGPDDEMNKKPDDRIKDGMKLTVYRVEYKEEKETETIDYGTIEQYSHSMDLGTSTIEQYGSEGEKEVTYRVKYVDGKEDSREVIKEEVTKEPVDEIITYGTYEAPASSGRTETGRTAVYDCDGSGHGYYEIYYSDGSVEYETF